MSVVFLEPAYPAPGHVHRGQLQLVEVSRAGPGTRGRPGSQHDPAGPWGPEAAVRALWDRRRAWERELVPSPAHVTAAALAACVGGAPGHVLALEALTPRCRAAAGTPSGPAGPSAFCRLRLPLFPARGI